MIEAVCRALGIERGPVNFDFVVGLDGQVYLVEMGARPGGNGTPRLVLEAFGVNIAEASIQIALGEPFEVRSRRRRAAALYLLQAERDGELAAVQGAGTLAACPSWSTYELYAPLGQTVLAYNKAANKLGHLVLAGDSRGRVERALAGSRGGPAHEREHPRRGHEAAACWPLQAVPFAVLAGAALARRRVVWIAMPHEREVGALWVLLVKLLPFVLATEAMARIDLEGTASRWLARVALPAAFGVFFCCFVAEDLLRRRPLDALLLRAHPDAVRDPVAGAGIPARRRCAGGGAAAGLRAPAADALGDRRIWPSLTVNPHTDPR